MSEETNSRERSTAANCIYKIVGGVHRVKNVVHYFGKEAGFYPSAIVLYKM